MKKLSSFIIIILVLIVLLFSGRKLYIHSKQDTHHARFEVSTSEGGVLEGRSYNETESTFNPIEEYAISNRVILNMRDGEVATIHFWCKECGHNESVEIVSGGKMLQCDCPKKMNDKKEVREYVAFLVTHNPDEDYI